MLARRKFVSGCDMNKMGGFGAGVMGVELWGWSYRAGVMGVELRVWRYGGRVMGQELWGKG